MPSGCFLEAESAILQFRMGRFGPAKPVPLSGTNAELKAVAVPAKQAAIIRHWGPTSGFHEASLREQPDQGKLGEDQVSTAGWTRYRAFSYLLP